MAIHFVLRQLEVLVETIDANDEENKDIKEI